VLRLAVYNNAVAFGGNLFPAVPYFFYKRTGGVVLFSVYALIMQCFFQLQGGAKRRDQYNIITGYAIERHQLFSIGILQKLNTPFLQISIYLRVVYHFAEQVNFFAGIFLNGPESNFDSVFHAIAESKMTGQVNFQWT